MGLWRKLLLTIIHVKRQNEEYDIFMFFYTSAPESSVNAIEQTEDSIDVSSLCSRVYHLI